MKSSDIHSQQLKVALILILQSVWSGIHYSSGGKKPTWISMGFFTLPV